MPTFVTISRYWMNPQITTALTEDGISLQIGFDDFIQALREEIGPVTWTFKADTWDKQFADAVTRVIERVKEESAKVV